MGNELVVVGLVLAASVVAVLVLWARRRRPNGSGPTSPPDAGSPGIGGRPGAGGTDDDAQPSPPRPPGAGAGGAAGGDRHAPAVPPPDPASVRPEAPTSHTLGSLLRAIVLPCGLTPHAVDERPDPDRYTSLVTTEALASEVARAMSAELERLGFEVHGLSEDDLVARRDDELLSVRVHARADLAQHGGGLLFPGAPPTAVVVELWVGAGPSPRHG